MNTEDITKLLAHIKMVYENQVIYNAKVLEIYRGQLKKHVVESLKKELSQTSWERAIERIPPINILQQLCGKTNRTYSKPAIRKPVRDNAIDNEILVKAEKKWDIDKKMEKGSDYLTLNKYFAYEFTITELGEEICNLLSADKFVVYSDNKYEPHKPTAFIKLMGNRQKNIQQTTDQFGNSLTNPIDVWINVEFYQVWTKDTWFEVDSTGEMTISLPNPYGFIPVLYVREDETELMPTPDSDIYNMAVLMPKLLTDVNYALQFQSHSIMYGIDVDPSGLTMSPDSFWNIKSISKGDEKVTPTIGVINPSVDSDKAIAAYKAEFSMWLEARGIKVGAVQETSNNASGVSKQLDEADATSIRETKVRTMAKVEERFWDMYKKVREVWATSGKLNEEKPSPFTLEFELSITFAEQQPAKDTMTTLNEIKVMNELGIVTQKMMIQMVFPNKSEKEIDLLLIELKTQKAEAVKEAQDNMSHQANVNGKLPAVPNNKPNTAQEDDLDGPAK